MLSTGKHNYHISHEIYINVLVMASFMLIYHRKPNEDIRMSLGPHPRALKWNSALGI